MKRDTAKQVEHLTQSNEGALYSVGQEVSFFDETTGEWKRGVVIGADVKKDDTGAVHMQVETPDRTIALEFTKDELQALPKPIEYEGGRVAFIDATRNTAGAETGRKSFYIDAAEIQPDGTVHYTVREYEGNFADNKQIAKHEHVPQELLKAYERVITLREKVRNAEGEIFRKTKEHRDTLQQQKKEAEAHIQKIYDVLPEVADMGKAASLDVAKLRAQIDGFHDKAEDLIQDLEAAIALAEDEQVSTIDTVQLTPKERAELLAYSKDIGKQLAAAERQFEDEASRKAKEFKEEAVEADIEVLKKEYLKDREEDLKKEREWKAQLKKLEQTQHRLEQEKTRVTQQVNAKEGEVQTAKDEYTDARQNNVPDRQFKRAKSHYERESAELKELREKLDVIEKNLGDTQDEIREHKAEKPPKRMKLETAIKNALANINNTSAKKQTDFDIVDLRKDMAANKDYSDIVEKRAKKWKEQQMKDFYRDLLRQLRTEDTPAARQLMDQIDVSRMGALKVQTADLEEVTFHGKSMNDYRDRGDGSVYEQKNIELLRKLVDGAQRDDMSEFTHYAETEGAFNFDTKIEATGQKAAALLAELEALPEEAQPRPLIRELKQIVATSGRARKELSSLKVAKKLSSIDYTAVAHPDPSTLDKGELDALRNNAVAYLDARLEKVETDWATIQTSRAGVESPAAEAKGRRETKDLMLSFSQTELMEVVKERLPQIRETMREMYTEGLNDTVKAGFRNMFEKGKPQPQLMKELKRAGIHDWDAFVDLWQAELSDSVAETMHEAAEADMRKKAAAVLSDFEKFKKELGPTSWKILKDFVLFGGAAIGAGALATAFAPALAGGLVFGMGTTAAGTGIMGTIRGFFRRKNNAEENERAKSAKRLSEMVEKKREQMIETLLTETYGVDGQHPDTLSTRFDGLPMFASVLGQVMYEKTSQTEEIHGITFTAEGRRLYIRTLEQLNPKERTEAKEKELALLIAKMQDTGDTMQTLREIQAKKDPRVNEPVGQQFRAIDESKTGGGIRRAASDFARTGLWGAASYGVVNTANAAGGLLSRFGASGLLGGAMSAFRANKDKEHTIIREKKAEIAKEFLDTTMQEIMQLSERIKDGTATAEVQRVFAQRLQEMRNILKGGGTDIQAAVWDYFIDFSKEPPVETAYYKQAKSMRMDAETLALKEGLMVDRPADVTRLDGLAKAFDFTTDYRTDGEQQADENQEKAHEKRLRTTGRVYVAKQGVIGAIRSIATGVAFLGAAEVGGNAYEAGKELYNDMYNPAVSEGNPGYQDYLDQQQEYRDARAARDAAAAEEAAAREQAEQAAALEAEPTYNPNIDAYGNELHTTVTLESGGSVWGALDRFFADNQELFAEKGITDRDAFREWRAEQLDDLGYRYIDGQWGHPVVVHEGAQVELVESPSGALEARIVDPTGDTVDARDTLYFRDTTPDTAAIEAVLQQDTPAPSDTMSPADAFRAQQEYLDTNNDGYVSSAEEAIYRPENATLAEARADFNARVPLTPEESAWVGNLVNAAAESGYSSDTLLSAIDGASGNSNGSFESQELLDFVRSSDRSPEAFVGLLEAIDGGSGSFEPSDIPANAPDSFTSTFAANNPDMAPGEVVELGETVIRGDAANTNVELVTGTELTPVEFGQITQEAAATLERMHGYTYDNASANYLYASLANFIDNALQNSPEQIAVSRGISGDVEVNIGQTIENMAVGDNRFDAADFEVLFDRPSASEPIVANGGHTLSYYQNGETHVLHNPGMHFDVVNGELQVWLLGEDPSTAEAIDRENITALVDSINNASEQAA